MSITQEIAEVQSLIDNSENEAQHEELYNRLDYLYILQEEEDNNQIRMERNV